MSESKLKSERVKSETPKPRLRDYHITAAAKISCVFFMGLYALISVSTAVIHCAIPYPLGYGENCVLVSAWGMLNGYGLYSKEHFESVPAFLSVYTPIYYLALAVGVKIWGVTHTPGRILSLSMAIGCAILIYLIGKKRFGDKFGALVGSGAFFASWHVFVWMRYSRVDFFSIFFELAAIYVLLGGINKTRWVLFVAFSLIAFYTKQIAVGLTASALLGFFIAGDRTEKKKYFLIGSSCLVGAILIFIILNVVTDGGFYTLAVSSNNVRMSSANLVRNLELIFIDPLNIAVLGVGLFGAFSTNDRKWTAPFGIIPLVIALATVGKHGSNINYFIEAFAAYGLCIAGLFKKRENERHYLPKIMVVCLILTFSSAVAFYCRLTPFTIWMNQFKHHESMLSFKPTVSFMKKNIKPGSLILAQQSDLPLLAGCVPALNDPFQLTELARLKKWDQTPLLNALKNKQIALVATRERITTNKQLIFTTEEAASLILQNYVLLKFRPNNNYLYIPNYLYKMNNNRTAPSRGYGNN